MKAATMCVFTSEEWKRGFTSLGGESIDGRSFAAHRVVLASACDFFNRHYDNEHTAVARNRNVIEVAGRE